MDGDSLDVTAGRCVVDHLRDVFDQEPVHERMLDETETLDMLGLESKVIGATALASRRLEKAAFPVEPHMNDAHAHKPGQLSESEWS
ncbi:MAG TPA: hypothetical protein VKY24_12380 [Reyranella sp.]|nr:hypothetical protein [Reyranella sp.]